MKGGYVMVDFGGINLGSPSAVTIPGIYARLREAFMSGKPVIAYNMMYSRSTNVLASPTQCSLAVKIENGAVTGTIHVNFDRYYITVTTEDRVT